MTDYSEAGGHARALLRHVTRYLPDIVQQTFKAALESRFEAIRSEERGRFTDWLHEQDADLAERYIRSHMERTQASYQRLTALLEAVEVELSDTEDSLKQKMVRGKLTGHYALKGPKGEERK